MTPQRPTTLLSVGICFSLIGLFSSPSFGSGPPSNPPKVSRASPTRPSDDQLLKQGKLLFDRYYKKWVAAMGPVNPRSKDSFERGKKVFDRVIDPMDDDALEAIIRYYAELNDKPFDWRYSNFRWWMARYLVEQAVRRDKPDDAASALAAVWVPNLDGHRIEWVLEKQMGCAVEVLMSTYNKTRSDRIKDEVVRSFERAFPNLPNTAKYASVYLAECHAYLAEHRGVLVLNEEYEPAPRPNQMFANNAQQAQPERPPRALFVPKPTSR